MLCPSHMKYSTAENLSGWFDILTFFTKLLLCYVWYSGVQTPSFSLQKFSQQMLELQNEILAKVSVGFRQQRIAEPIRNGFPTVTGVEIAPAINIKRYKSGCSAIGDSTVWGWRSVVSSCSIINPFPLIFRVIEPRKEVLLAKRQGNKAARSGGLVNLGATNDVEEAQWRGTRSMGGGGRPEKVSTSGSLW